MLPNEIWHKTIEYLEPDEKAVISSVCRLFTTKQKNRTARLHMLAAKRGYSKVVRWCSKSGHQIHRDVFNLLAANGDYKTVKYLTKRLYKGHTPLISDKATIAAAATGNLKILKYFYRTGCFWQSDEALIEAAKNGHLNTLKWLFWNDKDAKTKHEPIIVALQNRHDKIAKWLIKYTRIKPEFIIRDVLKSGLELVIKLDKKYNPVFTQEVFDAALCVSTPDVVRYLQTKGSYDFRSVGFSAICNNLEMVKFVHEELGINIHKSYIGCIKNPEIVEYIMSHI